MLLSDCRDVVVEFVVCRANVSDTLTLVLRTTCGAREDQRGSQIQGAGLTGSSKDLEDVEDTEVDKRSLPTVVNLSSLDDDGVGGQVDSPSECCSAA